LCHARPYQQNKTCLQLPYNALLCLTGAAEEPKKGVEDLLKIAKGCLTNPEAKQKFFDGLVIEDSV